MVTIRLVSSEKLEEMMRMESEKIAMTAAGGNDPLSFDINNETISLSSRFPTQQLEMIKVSDINVDRDYQRPLSDKKLREICESFNAKSFGAILVSRRSDGSIWTYDGQHRKEAITRLFGGDAEVPCIVLEGLSREEEAKAFVDIQTKRGAPQAIHRFRAELFAGAPHAHAIKRIIEDMGFSIVEAHTRNSAHHSTETVAVSALERVYKAGGEEGLVRVLSIISDAWYGERGSLRGDIIEGLWAFLARYEGMVFDTRLKIKLSEVTPITIVRQSRQIRDSIQVSASRGLGMAILMRYNHRLAIANKLPSWETARTISNMVNKDDESE